MVRRSQIAENLNQFPFINPGCKARVDGPDDLFTRLGISLRQNEGANYKQKNDRSHQGPLSHGPLSSVTRILQQEGEERKNAQQTG
jgi:hypothetical protein